MYSQYSYYQNNNPSSSTNNNMTQQQQPQTTTSSTSNQVWNGQQWVPVAATTTTTITQQQPVQPVSYYAQVATTSNPNPIIKHGKTHAELVQRYTDCKLLLLYLFLLCCSFVCLKCIFCEVHTKYDHIISSQLSRSLPYFLFSHTHNFIHTIILCAWYNSQLCNISKQLTKYRLSPVATTINNSPKRPILTPPTTSCHTIQ